MGLVDRLAGGLPRGDAPRALFENLAFLLVGRRLVLSRSGGRSGAPVTSRGSAMDGVKGEKSPLAVDALLPSTEEAALRQPFEGVEVASILPAFVF